MALSAGVVAMAGLLVDAAVGAAALVSPLHHPDAGGSGWRGELAGIGVALGSARTRRDDDCRAFIAAFQSGVRGAAARHAQALLAATAPPVITGDAPVAVRVDDAGEAPAVDVGVPLNAAEASFSAQPDGGQGSGDGAPLVAVDGEAPGVDAHALAALAAVAEAFEGAAQRAERQLTAVVERWRAGSVGALADTARELREAVEAGRDVSPRRWCVRLPAADV